METTISQYSHLARLFLLVVILCGIVAAAGTTLLPATTMAPPSAILCAITLILALVAGGRKVSLVRSPQLSELCCISLGFFITIFSLFAFGPRMCVLTAAISAIGACAIPRPLPLHQFLFNVASMIVTAWVAAFTYSALKSGPEPWMHLPLFQTLAAASVYFLMNSGLLAIIIALTSHKRILAIWTSLFWTGPSYLAGAALATMLELWAGTNWNLLLMVPVVVFIHQWYQSYVDRQEEIRKHQREQDDHHDEIEESRAHLHQQERQITELEESRRQLSELYSSTVSCLASAIDAKDVGTQEQLQRVQKLAVVVAESLDVKGSELEAVRTGALLHDIGMLSVPDEILLKEGPLTDDQLQQMKQHTIIGAELLGPVQFPWPVAAVVRHHHERWDGTGYPDALAGAAIPLSARIVAVADVYDALTSDRPYRSAWTPERAQQYVREASNTQFDPSVVDALLEYLQHETAGP